MYGHLKVDLAEVVVETLDPDQAPRPGTAGRSGRTGPAAGPRCRRRPANRLGHTRRCLRARWVSCPPEAGASHGQQDQDSIARCEQPAVLARVPGRRSEERLGSGDRGSRAAWPASCAAGGPPSGTRWPPSIPPHITLVTTTPVQDWDGATDARARGRPPAGSVHAGHARDRDFRPVSPVVYLVLGTASDAASQLHRQLQSGPLERELDFDFHPHVTVAHEVSEASMDRPRANSPVMHGRFRVSSDRPVRADASGVWNLREELTAWRAQPRRRLAQRRRTRCTRQPVVLPCRLSPPLQLDALRTAARAGGRWKCCPPARRRTVPGWRSADSWLCPDAGPSDALPGTCTSRATGRCWPPAAPTTCSSPWRRCCLPGFPFSAWWPPRNRRIAAGHHSRSSSEPRRG